MDRSASSLSVLLVGSWNDREFHQPLRTLRARSRLVAVPALSDAERMLNGSRWFPDLIVVTQSRPGQFCQEQFLRVMRTVPLTRMVALLGSWCEGETRTGYPLPAARRIFWYQWYAHFLADLIRAGRAECPAWGLPETASDEDRLLLSRPRGTANGCGSVVLAGRSRETEDALADACRSAGYQVHDPAQSGCRREKVPCVHSDAVAAIWEGTQCDPDEARQLADWVRTMPGVPVIALLDFPRTDGVRRAWMAGARSVLAKPYRLDALYYHLAQAALTRQESQQGETARLDKSEHVPRLAG